MVAQKNIAGDPFRKVVTGDRLRIPAVAYNAFIDAAVANRNQQANGKGIGTQAIKQAGIVLVENVSGADADRFDILTVTAPILSPTDNEDEFTSSVKLQGLTPTSGYRGPFAVTLAPIANNAIGPAVISGVTLCQVKMIRSTDTFAHSTQDEAGYLTSNTWGGAEILWADVAGDSFGADSDPVWAMVRLRPAEIQASFAVGDYSATLTSGDAINPLTLSSSGGGTNLSTTAVSNKFKVMERGTYSCWASIHAEPSASDDTSASITFKIEANDSTTVAQADVHPKSFSYAEADSGDDGFEITAIKRAVVNDFSSIASTVIFEQGDTISLSSSGGPSAGSVAIAGRLVVFQVGAAPPT